MQRPSSVPITAMKRFPSVLTAIFALAALPALACAADPLATVFEHIDAAAKSFKGITANISNTEFHALVDDTDVQTGTFKLLRVNPTLTRVLLDLTGGMNGAQSRALNGDKALVYNPKTKILAEYDIAKYKDTASQFLALGFGATSAALKASYDVTYVAEETIGGKPTAHLKLVPKSKEVLRQLKQAELWFGDDGLSVKQKFLQPSGDYRLAAYSNMKQAATMQEKDLDLNPKGATRQKMETR